MEELSFITCAACVLFLTGRCSCFLQTGGPRHTGSGVSCKCVTVWYLTAQKKQSRKTLFHLNRNRTCDCDLVCLKNGDRCVAQGKIAFHPKCRELWRPCAHMTTVAAQLKEYSEAVRNSIPKVPEGCIPLIGYSKKTSTMLKIETGGRNLLEERQIALNKFKEKHALKHPLKRLQTQKKP